jgi:hypothetical protein
MVQGFVFNSFYTLYNSAINNNKKKTVSISYFANKRKCPTKEMGSKLNRFRTKCRSKTQKNITSCSKKKTWSFDGKHC